MLTPNDNAETHFRNHTLDATSTAVGLTVLLMQYVFHVSRRGASFLIQCMITALEAAGVSERVIAQIPHDPRTILGDYNLDPIFTPHLSCPSTLR